MFGMRICHSFTLQSVSHQIKVLILIFSLHKFNECHCSLPDSPIENWCALSKKSILQVNRLQSKRYFLRGIWIINFIEFLLLCMIALLAYNSSSVGIRDNILWHVFKTLSLLFRSKHTTLIFLWNRKPPILEKKMESCYNGIFSRCHTREFLYTYHLSWMSSCDVLLFTTTLLQDYNKTVQKDSKFIWLHVLIKLILSIYLE